MSPSQPQPTATQKLLEHIRSAAPAAKNVQTVPRRNLPRRNHSLFSKEHSVVGVHAANGWLTLAQRRTGTYPTLEAVHAVRVPDTFSLAAPEGAALLHKELQHFLPSPEQATIWVGLPEGQDEVRHYRIPKVPAKDRAAIALMTTVREKAFNEASTLFDYREGKDVLDKGVPRTPITALIAEKNAVFTLRNTLLGAGIQPDGITSSGVYTQNLFTSGWLSCPWKHFGFVNIGEDSTHIEIFGDELVLLSRTIKTGLHSLAAILQEEPSPLASAPHSPQSPLPVQLPEDLLPMRSPLQTPATPRIMEPAHTIPFVSATEPVSPSPAQSAPDTKVNTLSYTECKQRLCALHRTPQEEQDLLKRVSQPLTRLARQIERTADYFRNTMNMPPIQGIIVFAPGGCLPLALKKFEELLGIPCTPLRLDGQAAPGALIDLEKIRAETDDGLLQAIGLAMSDPAYTPNAVMTHQDRQTQTRQKRLALLSSGITTLVLTGVLLQCTNLYFHYREGQKELARLEADIASWQHVYSPDELRQETARVLAFQKTAQELAGRRLSAALLVELSAASSPSIRLTGMRLSFTSLHVPLCHANGSPLHKNVSYPSLHPSPQAAWRVTSTIDCCLPDTRRPKTAPVAPSLCTTWLYAANGDDLPHLPCSHHN